MRLTRRGAPNDSTWWLYSWTPPISHNYTIDGVPFAIARIRETGKVCVIRRARHDDPPDAEYIGDGYHVVVAHAKNLKLAKVIANLLARRT